MRRLPGYVRRVFRPNKGQGLLTDYNISLPAWQPLGFSGHEEKRAREETRRHARFAQYIANYKGGIESRR